MYVGYGITPHDIDYFDEIGLVFLPTMSKLKKQMKAENELSMYMSAAMTRTTQQKEFDKWFNGIKEDILGKEKEVRTKAVTETDFWDLQEKIKK